MHPEAPVDDAFRDATRAYFASELEAGRLLAWTAEVDGGLVGLALLMVHTHPPRMRGRTACTERRGYVTTVFVDRDHRRRGVARAMMESLLAHARTDGLRRVLLRTSDDGRALYESLGFADLEHLAWES